MLARNYLKQLLTKSSDYSLNEEEIKQINNLGLEKFILKRLLSKKFRKTKAVAECIDRTTKAVSIQIKAKLPIELVFFQGGYKLWRLPSSPEVDWAEFFNISYLLNYVSAIAKAYKPGVKITYFCHTLLMEKHDNLPTADILAYMNSFESLISSFRKYLPSNISLSILKDSDLYEREDYFTALESGKEQARIDMQSWTPEKLRDYQRMAHLNIKWDGIEDWTKLSESQKQDKINEAGMYEYAATTSLPKIMNTVKAENFVLLFTKANPLMIGIGSTYSSIAKYWVGYGVLELHKDSYLPRILTPSQLKKSSSLSPAIERVHLIPNLRNFSEIQIFNNPLEFKN